MYVCHVPHDLGIKSIFSYAVEKKYFTLLNKWRLPGLAHTWYKKYFTPSYTLHTFIYIYLYYKYILFSLSRVVRATCAKPGKRHLFSVKYFFFK